MSNPKVIISGGGTGGHIFPAIAVANTLKQKHRDIEILFVGAEGRMEMEKVPKAGYKIEGLWISGLQRRLTFKNLMFPFKLISSMIRARRIIKEFKPDVVAGFGGFASGPMLQTACKKGVPTVIQEQNSYPGITNKILGSQVNKICVAYNGMEKFFPKEKLIITGNPVRQDITAVHGKREEALRHFGLASDKKVLLIIGGSLGARTINESIESALKTYADEEIQLIWQTGKGFDSRAKEATKPYEGRGIKSFDFLNKMDLAYAVADLVVSRAGAMSVSELCLAGKAAILVPSPNVAEDHQTKNAMAIVNNNGALLVKDIDARDKLAETVVTLIKDEKKMEAMRANIKQLAYTDSAEIIANEISVLMKNN